MSRRRIEEMRIRLRALQLMIVCDLRAGLAGEVKTICGTNLTPPDQAERLRKNDEVLWFTKWLSFPPCQAAKHLASLCPVWSEVHVADPQPEWHSLGMIDESAL